MVPTRPDPVTPRRRRVGVSPRRKRKFPRFWHSPIPDGAYSPIPTWVSHDRWLNAVKAAASTQPWTRKRQETLLSVASLLARRADVATGRGVRVANETIARALDVEVRTVQRHLRDLTDLGLIVTVDQGRHLTRDERIAAYEATDRVMIRKTATRALTLPRDLATSQNVTPPTASAVGLDPQPVDGTNARRARRRRRHATRTRPGPRPLALQRLAAHLVHRWGWLARTRHIGALCDALHSSGVDPALWTASDVLAAVDGWHRRQNRRSLAHEAYNRLGWLVWAIRSALCVGFTPSGRSHLPGELEAAAARRLHERAAMVAADPVRVEDSPAAQEALRIAREAATKSRALRLAA